jgi:hypothetical protein
MTTIMRTCMVPAAAMITGTVTSILNRSWRSRLKPVTIPI